PVVAVLVAPAAVAGEILAGMGGEIGLHEALVIAVDRAHLAGPGIEDHQVAGGGALQRGTLVVHQRRLDAEERPRRRAGLELGGAGQRRNQNAAGLGLPPGVDDRAAPVAYHTVIPLPRLGIDRLAHAAEQFERRAVGALHVVVAGAHQRAYG